MSTLTEDEHTVTPERQRATRLSGAQAFALDLLITRGRMVKNQHTRDALERRKYVEWKVDNWYPTDAGREALKRYGTP